MTLGRFIIGLLVLLLAEPALAQDKQNPKDAAAIEKCIKTKTKVGLNWLTESCIGVISNPCAKDGSMRDRDLINCFDRELAVWDDMLNTSYRALLKALDEDQQGKLREMQRAWITSHDKTCEFLYDYFQGTMANPMIAACKARATGRQALYLRGFAEDIAGRK